MTGKRAKGISREQLAEVARLRANAPTVVVPAGGQAFMGVIATFMLAVGVFVLAKGLIVPGTITLLMGAGAAFATWWLHKLGARHLGAEVEGRFLQWRIEAPGRLPVHYRIAASDPTLRWLRIARPLPTQLEISAKTGPLMEPAFDARFGMSGEPPTVALLGPDLRRIVHAGLNDHAPHIDARGLRLTLADRPLPDHRALDTLAKALDAYGHRLAEPLVGLEALARDLTEPFDAARALAVLQDMAPRVAGEVCADLSRTPVGEALVRIVRTGEGLDAPALSAAQRSAIGRGVLRVATQQRAALLDAIAKLAPATPEEAMAAVELGEAALTLGRSRPIRAAIERHLALIEASGGPACLPWLERRASTDRAARIRLQRVNGRLAAQLGGQLSLDAPDAGALSETVSGHLEVVEGSDAGAAHAATHRPPARLTVAQRRLLKRGLGRRGALGVSRGTEAVLFAIFGVGTGLSLALSTPAIAFVTWAGLIAFQLAQPTFRGMLVNAVRTGRMFHTVGGPTAAVRIRVEDKLQQKAMVVRVETDSPLAVDLDVSRPAILDPRFDGALGLRASDRRRALLGPILRRSAPMWHAMAGFRLVDGEAELRVGKGGIKADDPVLHRIVEAVEAYAWRLAADPVEALSAMARDLEHPFDAARALAALHRDWIGPPQRVAAEIEDTPLGALIGRMALTGEGLDDDAVSWADRSAIARGVMGIDGPPKRRLLDAIATLELTDEASAIALVELAEAAQALRDAPAFDRARAAALKYLASDGGEACLAWLEARAAYDPLTQPLVETVRARLLSARWQALRAAQASGG